LKAEVAAILDAQVNDSRSAWEMQSDGTYVQRRPSRGSRGRACQDMMVAAAEQRAEKSKRLRKVKPRAFARRAPK
jgi:polyphosphate kinase